MLRKNGYLTEDYTFLLFYYPNNVLETVEVVFDTKLIKIKTNASNGEKVFKEAVKILSLDTEPEACKKCGFCKWLFRAALGSATHNLSSSLLPINL